MRAMQAVIARAGRRACQRIAGVLALALACAACSDSDGGGGSALRDAGRPGDGDAAANEHGAARGRFVITLVAEVPASGDLPATPAYASLLGTVYDGPPLAPTPWVVTEEEGDCRLLEPTRPLCDPPCRASEVCVADGMCAAHPDTLDVGTVTVRGLRAQDGADVIELRPLTPSDAYQLPGSVRLEYPPFAEGDRVTLEADGGALAPFSMSAPGIAPLALIGEGDIDFSAETATELRWTPPAEAGRSRVRVNVDISHHGGQKGEIECETDDDGALTIPQPLGARLIELGVAGYPGLQIAREALGEAPGRVGRIELVLSSPVNRELQIPGLVSCDEPGEQDVCSEGQLCRQDRRCE